jgi:choice-of-anchor C domain-containing protein
MIHTRSICTVSLTAIVGLVTSAALASANVIVNGSFETGPAPGVSLNLASGSTAISGWVVTPSNIDYVGTEWTAAQGQRSIGLNGDATGGIAQTFASLPGARYSVRFWIAGDPGSVPVVKHVRSTAAGQSADFAVDITDMWAWDPGWSLCRWNFVANTTSTTLEIRSLDAGAVGPSVDSVTVLLKPPTDTEGFPVTTVYLSPVVPNPVGAAGTARIEYGLPIAGPVDLRLFDSAGRVVATLLAGSAGPGRHTASWDGRLGNGAAPAGIYFLELRAGDVRRTQRVVRLR